MSNREIAALMVASPTPLTRQRLSELIGIEHPLPSTPALRFESVAMFAHEDGAIAERRLLESDADVVAAPGAFEGFVASHPSSGCEMFGRRWDWAGGGTECLASVRRPPGVDVGALAEEAFEEATPKASFR